MLFRWHFQNVMGEKGFCKKKKKKKKKKKTKINKT